MTALEEPAIGGEMSWVSLNLVDDSQERLEHEAAKNHEGTKHEAAKGREKSRRREARRRTARNTRRRMSDRFVVFALRELRAPSCLRAPNASLQPDPNTPK